MKTIALIGADGSGKTTIAKRILENPPVKIKYIYMGLNIESSNYALPTSRLMHFIKVYKYKKKKNIKGSIKNISLHSINEDRNEDTRGVLGATFRTLNRISEHLYRQLIAVFFQFLGYTILFDRHYLFDGAIDKVNNKNYRMSSRVYSWLLYNVLPKPDFTLFLYAPPKVLHQRKIETSLEYLEGKNKSLEYIGSNVKNFVRIDATLPLEEVLKAVKSQISKFCKNT
jgi:thymidylate kinase